MKGCPAIVNVPDRALAVPFAAAVNTTFDVPPLPLDEIVSHAAEASARDCQPQTPGAVTVTPPVPPPKGIEAFDDPSTSLQIVPPWVTATDWPATVRLVLLETVDDAFEVAVTVIAPLPDPYAGETVAQDTGLEAVQVQFDPFAVTAKVPDPLLLPNGLPELPASTVTLHGVGSCVIVNNLSPMLRAPLRLTVVEFAATE